MALPYFEVPPIDVGVKIQPFGIIVLVGIAIGARVMRAYGERQGMPRAQLDGLTTWLVVSGFVGAHLFELLAYRPHVIAEDPLVLVMIWTSIASYGGFLGGAIGFSIYVWRKRLRVGRWADIAALGTLLAFSIGRIGCSTVHDHIGGPTDFALGFDFPRDALAQRGIVDQYATSAPVVRAHDLGFYELLYLIPVCGIVIWLAFRGKRRPAGFLAALIGLLYTPLRFALDFLRLDKTDRPLAGLTPAQWCSIAAFAIAGYVAVRVLRSGRIAPLAVAR
jgi:phosphatidylglycerol---prolipoprotein diacylglyceryl transferase